MKINTCGKTCHKVGYHTKEAARTALNEFGRARGAKRFYKCPHCRPRNGAKGVWHLTSEDR
jgi:hypothetical protein